MLPVKGPEKCADHGPLAQTGSETVVSYNFQSISDSALAGLQADLTAAAGPSTYNVFFNRPGAL